MTHRQIAYFGSNKDRFQLQFPESVCQRLGAMPKEFLLKSQRKGVKRFWTPFIQERFATLQKLEEEKQALWEKAVEVRARFCMTKPIGEVLGVEAELRKQLPREENACVLSDLTRYAMWGVGERGCDDG